jgi:CrcB protein
MTTAFSGYAWVAVGGALGAMARMGLGQWVRTFAHGPFPWHTFVINVLGSFALGLAATVIAVRAPTNTAMLNHFVAIGFVGAFTTFSTFELETWNLVAEGRWVLGLAYVVASVMAAFFGLGLGIMAGRLV